MSRVIASFVVIYGTYIVTFWFAVGMTIIDQVSKRLIRDTSS